MITPQASNNGYPLIPDIEDVVPKTFTQEIPVPHGIKLAPCTLWMVRWLGGAPPVFDTHPYCFTIPGRTMVDAFAFAVAMQATVRWTLENLVPPKVPEEKKSNAGRPPTYKWKLFYIFPRKGHHVAPLNSRKAKSGRKCGCKAKFNISLHHATDTLRVEWFWRHSHQLNTADDMKNTRISKAVYDWTCDRVDSGLGWDKIQDLLSSRDLDDLCETGAAIPEGNGVTADLVRHLIKTRRCNDVRKDRDVSKSLSLWEVHLKGLGWHTFALVIADSEAFLFCIQSPWQRKMMMAHGTTMLLVDATHNTVNNCFLSQGRKASLYTVMIRNAVTGMGLPVCWAFTGSLAIEPIQQILTWLCRSSGLTPHSIMSDCALAIKTAVTAAFDYLMDQAPRHYWCVFHVIKAFKAKALVHLGKRLQEAVDEFEVIMYSGKYPHSRMMIYLSKWRQVAPAFASYADSQWYTYIKHWSRFYQTTAYQGIDTNNYVEAWHHVLKSQYLKPSTRHRINEVIQIFCEVVEPRYSRKTCQVNTGFVKQTVNRFQTHAKSRADGIAKGYLELIGAKVCRHTHHFTIGSFASPSIHVYRVEFRPPTGVAQGRLVNCDCPYFARHGSACKHMYYLAREYKMLVVEQAPNTQQRNPPISLDSDSEIEVISCSTSPGTASSKRPNAEALSPRDNGFPKRACVDRMALTGFGTAHPALRSDGSRTTDPEPSTSNMTSLAMAEPLTHEGRMNNLFKSATVAFDRVKEALKKKANRKEMAKQSSTSRMHEFQILCHTLLRTVEDCVPRIGRTTAPSFPDVGDIATLNGAEIAVLVGELAEVSWAALKRMDGLLKTKTHLKAFIGNSDELLMILFKERIFEVVGMLENANLVAARTQIR